MLVAANRLTEPVYNLFRIVIGLLFTSHGLSTVFGMFEGYMGTGEAIPVGLWPDWYGSLIQVITGPLVLIGLFTRPAAVLASGSMAYAYFMVHQPTGLLPMNNRGEPAVLFCWGFLLIAVLGPGRWALDHLLSRRKGGAREKEMATAA
ncbi:integral membrane protein [Micromonospora sagamiensis]|uniref:Putative oxidoreductase n=1 Tax=Micromonospora sagamiensis TaxID=47875 RepID=A0A562WE03_9ACTN|nr:putative oxidoreductase [Micromonospora sagamiensis]BCL13014.1 integral membrane protein [Micromonospora sagamiensis]